MIVDLAAVVSEIQTFVDTETRTESVLHRQSPNAQHVQWLVEIENAAEAT